jgi:hypothetical protein
MLCAKVEFQLCRVALAPVAWVRERLFSFRWSGQIGQGVHGEIAMLAAESVYSVQPVKPFLMGCYACTAVAPVRCSQCAPYAHQRPFPKEILLQMSPVVARLPDMDPVSHCRSRFYSFETTLAIRSPTMCVLAADSQRLERLQFPADIP